MVSLRILIRYLDIDLVVVPCVKFNLSKTFSQRSF